MAKEGNLEMNFVAFLVSSGAPFVVYGLDQAMVRWFSQLLHRNCFKHGARCCNYENLWRLCDNGCPNALIFVVKRQLYNFLNSSFETQLPCFELITTVLCFDILPL